MFNKTSSHHMDCMVKQPNSSQPLILVSSSSSSIRPSFFGLSKKFMAYVSPFAAKTACPTLQVTKKLRVILNSVDGVVPTLQVTKKLRVAYQGVPGAYSEFAAKTACPDCSPLSCRSYVDAITAVEAGKADLAALPVESTMEGTALRNYRLLLQHDLPIVQEINLFVQYCLLAMPGVRKGELKRVISHPMALAHCGRALTELGLDREAVEDTVGAGELLLSNRMFDTAAIASSQAALLYGLDVLAHGVQDESWNVTRFLILSKYKKTPQASRFGYKTSMVVGHQTGSLTVLLKVLSAFSSRDISLTKLEVNPFEHSDGVKILDAYDGGVIKHFPCVLYVDFEGSMEHQTVKDAIAEISPDARDEGKATSVHGECRHSFSCVKCVLRITNCCTTSASPTLLLCSVQTLFGVRNSATKTLQTLYLLSLPNKEY